MYWNIYIYIYYKSVVWYQNTWHEYCLVWTIYGLEIDVLEIDAWVYSCVRVFQFIIIDLLECIRRSVWRQMSQWSMKQVGLLHRMYVSYETSRTVTPNVCIIWNKSECYTECMYHMKQVGLLHRMYVSYGTSRTVTPNVCIIWNKSDCYTECMYHMKQVGL